MCRNKSDIQLCFTIPMVINSLSKKEKRSNPNSGIALKIDATRDWDIGGPEISIWNTSASSEIRLVDELTVQKRN